MPGDDGTVHSVELLLDRLNLIDPPHLLACPKFDDNSPV
jgi:hypothetical protein